MISISGPFLVIYWLIGIAISFFDYYLCGNKFKSDETIVLAVFWPIALLIGGLHGLDKLLSRSRSPTKVLPKIDLPALEKENEELLVRWMKNQRIIDSVTRRTSLSTTPPLPQIYPKSP